NGRSFLPTWTDHSLASIRIKESHLDDPANLDCFVKMVRNRVRLTAGSSNHTLIALRSTSVTSERLQELGSRLQAGDTWNRYSSEHVANLGACAPTAKVLSEATRWVDGTMPMSGTEWSEVPFSTNSFRPPIVRPRHLGNLSHVPADLTQGCWSYDLDIE